MALLIARVINYAIMQGAIEEPAALEDPGFTDIGALGQEAQDAIALLYTLGVTKGTTATNYSPAASVTRRDMASFLVRTQNLIEEGSYDTEGWFFTDVTTELDRAADVNALAAQGIFVGSGDQTYRPFDPVLRSQMALYLMRFLDENVEAGRLPAMGRSGDRQKEPGFISAA
ncbi:MAG TPA: S-layer homology domain-containing protein [Thermoleophilia bacterium]|nr:S-layer homology domain-containing protein [Thermoleophilia bacterium]